LGSIGFEKYYLAGAGLKKAVAGEREPEGDLVFIHKEKSPPLQSKLRH
jgi:hypothetical protein